MPKCFNERQPPIFGGVQVQYSKEGDVIHTMQRAAAPENSDAEQHPGCDVRFKSEILKPS
jgi:hypothetical protein